MSDDAETCRTCDDVGPYGVYGTRHYCDSCVSNGRRDRDGVLRQRYGAFGLVAYEAMLFAQDGRCANPLCSNAPVTVDHDHACCPGRQTTCGKCVRWLLCNACNLAEGHLVTARRARGMAHLMSGGGA